MKIILPKTQAVTAQMLEGMARPPAETDAGDRRRDQNTVTVIFYVVFYTPFPILLLGLIGRESTKNDLVPG